MRIFAFGASKALELMIIAGTMTYGGYIDLPNSDLYTIVLTITRPSIAKHTTLRFAYDHRNQ